MYRCHPHCAMCIPYIVNSTTILRSICKLDDVFQLRTANYLPTTRIDKIIFIRPCNLSVDWNRGYPIFDVNFASNLIHVARRFCWIYENLCIGCLEDEKKTWKKIHFVNKYSRIFMNIYGNVMDIQLGSNTRCFCSFSED